MIGPSGCGKTTLLNVIAGLEPFETGEATVLGSPWQALDSEAKAVVRKNNMGFVFQFFNLLPTLTVAENVELSLVLSGKTNNAVEAVKAVAESVNIAHKLSAMPSQLSGGEMQRCAIARALIHSPKLLLADEPTGNLDSDTSEVILDLIEKVCVETGTTLLMVTHNPEATRIANRVIEMKDGQIIRDVQQ